MELGYIEYKCEEELQILQVTEELQNLQVTITPDTPTITCEYVSYFSAFLIAFSIIRHCRRLQGLFVYGPKVIA